jgi:hypothetical protein
MGYTNGCKYVQKLSLRDVSHTDFTLKSNAPVANGANWNVNFVLSPTKFEDIATITSCASADLFTDKAATVPFATLTAPAGGLPNLLNTLFLAIPRNTANTGNTWKVRYVNLVVRSRSNDLITIPSLVINVKSPFQ